MAYIILDTNFLIDELALCIELVPLLEYHKLILVIPYVVIQELDGLKPKLREKVQAANRFLLEALKNPSVQASQANIKTNGNNDDIIIEICKRFSHIGCVVLLTNDLNMCVKASANYLQSISNFRGSAIDLVFHIGGLPRRTLLDIDVEMASVDGDEVMSEENIVSFVIYMIPMIFDQLVIPSVEKYTHDSGSARLLSSSFKLKDLYTVIKAEWKTVFAKLLPTSFFCNIDRLYSVAKDIDRNIALNMTALTFGDLRWFLNENLALRNILSPQDKSSYQHNLENLIKRMAS
jgi:rRNA-processing protein FCF1